MNTPLHFAVEGTAELVEVLLKHHATINVCNVEGVNPLMAALRFSDVQSTQLILAELDRRPDEKSMTLTQVCKLGHDVRW
jgi:ankyrin repeat protein